MWSHLLNQNEANSRLFVCLIWVGPWGMFSKPLVGCLVGLAASLPIGWLVGWVAKGGLLFRTISCKNLLPTPKLVLQEHNQYVKKTRYRCGWTKSKTNK